MPMNPYGGDANRNTSGGYSRTTEYRQVSGGGTTGGGGIGGGGRGMGGGGVGGGGGGGGGGGMGMGIGGGNDFLSHASFAAIQQNRDRERRNLMELNDRFASYLEKVRFLEAQNRRLASSLELLTARSGVGSAGVKELYEAELLVARRLIEDTARAKKDLEPQVARFEAELRDARARYEDAMKGHDEDVGKVDGLLRQLSEVEAETLLLRRRIFGWEDEVARLKRENIDIVNEISKTRTELDQETLNRIDYQNQAQTLLEEIQFLRSAQEAEIGELEGLAIHDPLGPMADGFKSDLASAIADIRAEFETVTASNHTELEAWYKRKVQEVSVTTARSSMERGYHKEETQRLRIQLDDLRHKLADLEGRNFRLEKQVQDITYTIEDDQRQFEVGLNDRDSQIRKMREECQALMTELQMLLDTKQTLDAEIAIYRKMLEGEENTKGLRQLVEDAFVIQGSGGGGGGGGFGGGRGFGGGGGGGNFGSGFVSSFGAGGGFGRGGAAGRGLLDDMIGRTEGRLKDAEDRLKGISGGSGYRGGTTTTTTRTVIESSGGGGGFSHGGGGGGYSSGGGGGYGSGGGGAGYGGGGAGGGGYSSGGGIGSRYGGGGGSSIGGGSSTGGGGGGGSHMGGGGGSIGGGGGGGGQSQLAPEGVGEGGPGGYKRAPDS